MNIAVNLFEPSKEAAPARKNAPNDAPAFDLSYANQDPASDAGSKNSGTSPNAVETIKTAEARASHLLSATELTLTNITLPQESDAPNNTQEVPIQTDAAPSHATTLSSGTLELAASVNSKPGFVSPSRFEALADDRLTVDFRASTILSSQGAVSAETAEIAATSKPEGSIASDGTAFIVIQTSEELSAQPKPETAKVESTPEALKTAASPPTLENSAAHSNTSAIQTEITDARLQHEPIPATDGKAPLNPEPLTDKKPKTDAIKSNTLSNVNNGTDAAAITASTPPYVQPAHIVENIDNHIVKTDLPATPEANQGVENLVKHGASTHEAEQVPVKPNAPSVPDALPDDLPAQNTRNALEPVLIAEAGASRRVSAQSSTIGEARDAAQAQYHEDVSATESYNDVIDNFDDLRVRALDEKQKQAVTTAAPQTVKTVGDITAPLIAHTVNAADTSQRVQHTINLSSLPPQPHPALQQAAEVLIKANLTQSGVSVRLDPPELGNVTIQFQFDSERAVTAVIRTDVAETAALLRDRAEILIQTLKENGFGHVDLSFEHGSTDNQENSGKEREFSAQSMNALTSENTDNIDRTVNRNTRYIDGEKIDMKL